MAKKQPTGYYNPETGEFVQTTPAKKKHPINFVIIGVVVILLFMIGKCGGSSKKEDVPETDAAASETVAEPGETTAQEAEQPKTETPEEVAEIEEAPAAVEPEADEKSEPDPEPEETKKSSGGLLSWLFGGSENKEKEPTSEPEQEAELEISPEQGTPEWNKQFIDSHENEIIAAAKMSLDQYITDYTISLAPQKWTNVMFDKEGAVMAQTDITYNGQNGTLLVVFSPVLNENNKIEQFFPHYVEACGKVYKNDGYCDDVFDVLRGWIGNPEKIEGLYVQENYDPSNTYMAAYITNDVIEIYWMNADVQALYWAGTFEQPSSADEYTFDSVNDTDKTSTALLASSDPVKTMTIKNGTIQYTASISGTTMRIRLVPFESGVN